MRTVKHFLCARHYARFFCGEWLYNICKGSVRWVLGLTWWLSGKESVCQAGDEGRLPGEGNGNPLQYSCLGNSVVGGATYSMMFHKSRT